MTQADSAEVVRAAYVRWVEPTTGPFAAAALDRAGLTPGSEVLDVATGTGVLALAAARAGHRVRGIDRNRSVLDLAAERLAPHPGCAAEMMDARALTHPDDRFDAAFSAFGVTLDGAVTAAALAEMVRVVRPGGVVAVVHWARPAGPPAPALLQRAMVRLLGDPRAAAPLTGRTDRTALEHVLGAAGCVGITGEALSVDSPVPDPDTALRELHPLFGSQPFYASLHADQRDRLEVLYADVLRAAAAEPDGLVAHANLALGRVPEGATESSGVVSPPGGR